MVLGKRKKRSLIHDAIAVTPTTSVNIVKASMLHHPHVREVCDAQSVQEHDPHLTILERISTITTRSSPFDICRESARLRSVPNDSKQIVRGDHPPLPSISAICTVLEPICHLINTDIARARVIALHAAAHCGDSENVDNLIRTITRRRRSRIQRQAHCTP